MSSVIRTVHTGLTVRDLRHMAAFFRDVLGFTLGQERQIPAGALLGEITGVPGACARVLMVTAPGHVIELLEYSSPASSTACAPRPCDVGASHIAFEVDSVLTTAQRARAYGFEVAGSVQALSSGPFAGLNVAYIRDPDGFTLELIGH